MAKQIIIALYLLIISIASCKKKKVTKNHSEMVGSWKHYISNNEIQYLSIESDARGKIEYYKDGKFDTDTKSRKWFIKNSYLMFGRITPKDEKFKINSFPAVATYSFINGLDTVILGERYMTLNNNVYN
jgi:hypothetical protein